VGWISKRHMQQGGSIGPGGLKPHKKGSPLRRVVRTVLRSGSMFAPDHVLLECGHEAESWGGVRARCVKCKNSGRTCTDCGKQTWTPYFQYINDKIRCIACARTFDLGSK
jgi:hypothetical protein